MDSVTLKLSRPVKVGSEVYSELVFQEPKAKHIRALPTQPNTGDVLDLAAKLCGQPPSVIDELCMFDMQKALDIVTNFITPGPETGNKA